MNLRSQKKSRFDLVRCYPERCLFYALAVFILCTIAYLSRVPGASAAAPEEQGDATRGQRVFESRCTGCHSLDQDKEGPRLRGVFGRKAGSISTFQYSDAMKVSNITWDAASIDQWLADPDKIVPNSDMVFRVPKANERKDVIAYLQQLSK